MKSFSFAALAGALALALVFTIAGSADAFASVLPSVAGPVCAPALIAGGLIARGAARDLAAFRARLASGAARYETREAPDLRTISDTMERIARTMEEYRSANDQRLADLEKRKGDVLHDEKLARMDARLDELSEIKRSLEIMQTRAARPGAGVGGERGSSPEAREHRNALIEWMRDPRDGERGNRLRKAQKDLARVQGEDGWEVRAAQTVTSTGSAGGFALPEEIAREIDMIGRDVSPMRQICKVVQVGTPDYKELIDINGAAFEWVGETGTRNQTNTNDLFECAPTFGMGSARPRASEESLDDLFFNVEGWLQESAGMAIAQGEGAAFVAGNGTNRPTGFLAGPTPLTTVDGVRAFGTLQYIAGGQAAAMPTSPDIFHDMVYALRARYRTNARWVTSKLVLSALRKYKETTGNYLWQDSLVLGQPNAFLGYPVVEAEDMPAVAANAFPIAFGDFQQGYLIADRVGMRITRDEITIPGFVQFYVRKRVGGRIRNSEAIKLLRISTT